METHFYLLADENSTIIAPDWRKWDPPQKPSFHPDPQNEKLYHGFFIVVGDELPAGYLIEYRLEPVNPKQWALFQFWEAMKYNGKEATILQRLYYRTSLKDLRKQYKDPAQGKELSPAKIDQNRRLAWAALILRDKADLSHIQLPEASK